MYDSVKLPTGKIIQHAKEILKLHRTDFIETNDFQCGKYPLTDYLYWIVDINKKSNRITLTYVDIINDIRIDYHN